MFHHRLAILPLETALQAVVDSCLSFTVVYYPALAWASGLVLSLCRIRIIHSLRGSGAQS